VLFGSYARGRYTVASDVDVLVVYRGEPRSDAFALVKRAFDLPGLEPHPYSEREYGAVARTIDRMTVGGVVLLDEAEPASEGPMPR
jgi:predicted nucleotidyltransferase